MLETSQRAGEFPDLISGDTDVLVSLIDSVSDQYHTPLIITPNTRLAASLRQQLHAQCAARGTAWQLPTVMSLSQWVNELTIQAQLKGQLSLKPVAHRIEELDLWRSVIQRDDAVTVNAKSLAKQAMAAHKTLVEWCCDWQPERLLFESEEDTRAFIGWLAQYESAVVSQPWQSPVSVLAQLVAASERIDQSVMLVGFYDVAPLYRKLLSHCVSHQFFEWRHNRSQQLIAANVDAPTELRQMALWAKSVLAQSPDASICLCVPDLSLRREQVVAALDSVFQPRAVLPDEPRSLVYYNVSAGIALIDAPVANTLLRLLRALRQPLARDEWEALLLSPYWGAMSFDTVVSDIYRLQQMPKKMPTLGDIAVWLGRDSALEPLYEYSKTLHGRNTVEAWYQATIDVLALAQWPGLRTLTSDEYQQHQTCLEALASAMPLQLQQTEFSYTRWLELLTDVFTETIYQPQSQPCPIHVLGSLEASGQVFDYLWVCGLHDTAWPQPLKPNPFIPATLQQERQMPRGSHQRELYYAQRLLNGFAQGAAQVVLSHVSVVDDVHTPISRLIKIAKTAVLPPLSLELETDALADAVLEDVSQQAIPAVADETIISASTLMAQSLCPIRGFSQGRLKLEGLNEPCYGLSAADRGQLLHSALERLFSGIKSDQVLAALSRDERQQHIVSACEFAIKKLGAAVSRLLPKGIVVLEQLRLNTVVSQWLDFQSQTAFSIAKLEHSAQFSGQGITVNYRVDRIDSVDQQWRIIDYKSSAKRPLSWRDPRLSDPQLPLYAVATQHQRVVGIAIAHVRLNECAWSGLSEVAIGSEKILPQEEWQQLQQHWQEQITTLLQEYAQGEARVDPLKSACNYCSYSGICRIQHKEIVHAS